MTTQSYYESTAIVPKNRYLQLQLPQDIPIGSVRVAIVFEKKPGFQVQNQDIKSLLAAMPDVGEDADFSRQQDFGKLMYQIHCRLSMRCLLLLHWNMI